jgi:hypothetical protein
VLQEAVKERDRQLKELAARLQKQVEDTQLANETAVKRDNQVRSLLQKVKMQEQELVKSTDEQRKSERLLAELRQKAPKDTPDVSVTQLRKELTQAGQKLVAKEHELELLREMMSSWQNKYRAQEMDRIRKGFRGTSGTTRLTSLQATVRTPDEEDVGSFPQRSKKTLSSGR